MRKVQWILGFFLFASQIWGQGFVRSFEEPGLLYVSDMDSLGPDLWRLSLRYQWSGTGPDNGYTSHALFNPSSQVLGPIKRVSEMSSNIGSGFYRLPIEYFSPNWTILLGTHRHHPFTTASWVDLKDTAEQIWVYLPNMAVSLNWELGQNDSVFGLYNRLDYQSLRANDSKGTEYFYLSLMTKDSEKLQILDSFRLKADIYAPGTFLLDEDNRGFEYINDSLHYHYSRGKVEPDTFYVDTGFYYGGSKQSYETADYFTANFLTYKNRRYGKLRREENPSGYQVFRMFEDGSEELIRNIRYPHSDQAILNRTNWLSQDYRISEQPNGVNCITYQSDERDTLFLVRIANNQILKSRLFVRESNSDFELIKAHSFADGSFLLMGLVNYSLIPWQGSGADGHLIYIDPEGRTTYLSGDEAFNIHFDPATSSVKVFHDNLSARLSYRIVDASGRSMQEGKFQPYEGISLGDWKSGVYYLQLWTNQGAYLGQQSFIRLN